MTTDLQKAAPQGEEGTRRTVRTHRVGSVTAGLSMVGFGILLLVHSLFGWMNYQMIFSLWPIVLIGLGAELLLSNFLERRIIYDRAAVFLLLLMALFAMGMAATDYWVKAAEQFR